MYIHIYPIEQIPELLFINRLNKKWLTDNNVDIIFLSLFAAVVNTIN